MTLDGKIATRTGDSKWISNEASRRLVHQLRGRVDAIVVGAGTAVVDDPLLTARPPGPRIATRVVLDSSGRLPLEGRLVQSAREVPTLLATTGRLEAARRGRYEERGVEVVVLGQAREAGSVVREGEAPAEPAALARPEPRPPARVSVPALLNELGRRRFTNVLVEGGGEVLGSFLDAGEIDEVHVFIAPRLAGGAAARTPMAGLGVETIGAGARLAEWSVRDVEGDLYVQGRVAPRQGE
jgi:diaminohydroxyphosphoribosylaminopyrimidine deaminase/5-amino-6-(5-phosphoribosylamino)uracil reductase